MLDFLRIATRTAKNGAVEIYPNFVLDKSNDLMIRGGDFYAIWVEENGLWSTEEQDAIHMIDAEISRKGCTSGQIMKKSVLYKRYFHKQ